ncbi:ComF family protein [Saccharopolyspora sp. NPDC047091]|uniref:ComF family protein n=1 Tax=Saccharopolyspora sp. NPDC047091 TaxID=3155924 RepID=UPI00340E81F9
MPGTWGRVGGGVAAAVGGLVDLVLPLRCAGCARPGTGWCADCGRELGGLRRVVRALPAPPGDRVVLPPVFALGRYRGPVRRAIIDYKVAGRRDLAEPFGRALAEGLRGITGWEPELASAAARADPTAAGLPSADPLSADPLSADSPSADPSSAGPPSADLAQASEAARWHLVPAPSRPITSRRRGGAHMTRVARRTAAALAADGTAATVADCLTTSPGTRDSAGRSPHERLRDLAGRAAVRPDRAPPAAAPVLLIDDVLTTGATIASSVGALAGHGIPVTAVLVLAATAG